MRDILTNTEIILNKELEILTSAPRKIRHQIICNMEIQTSRSRFAMLNFPPILHFWQRKSECAYFTNTIKMMNSTIKISNNQPIIPLRNVEESVALNFTRSDLITHVVIIAHSKIVPMKMYFIKNLNVTH